ncbi:FtsK/SpoIIIE domain-containing protein [Bacillus infantis]|uniref:FtsK/SpoIIIE domain-containing protein n=1 Tax=Bacillus infantis TaxID=324767 RepID=UPI003CFB6894
MSLARVINKTPIVNESSNVFEADNIDSKTVQAIIQSRFISEGVYTLEQFSLPEYSERYVTTPSFDKLFVTVTDKSWDINYKDVITYELELSKPFFMPLDTKQFSDLFDFISKLENVSVLTQVLICKRQDNWREAAISQYEDFRKGIDHVSDLKIVRNIQIKALSVLNKISNFTFNREPIEEIEQKILSNVFRFECRFVLFEPKYSDYFEKNMSKQLKNVNLFNEIKLKKADNQKSLVNLIKQREFRTELTNQLLSQQEIFNLLCNENPVAAEEIVEVMKPVKKQNIITSLEESMFLQRATKILPFKDATPKEIDTDLPKRINNAFKRVGISNKNFKIIETHMGSALLKVQFEIPSDIMFTTIRKKLEDIQSALGNKSVSIEIGERPDSLNVYMPLEDRDIVYFKKLIESDEFKNFAKDHPLPFIIGENVNGGYMFGCLSKFRHMLIAGTSGSGKSVFLTLVLLCLLLTVSPDELEMYLIDPKMVELTMFEGFPQVKPIVREMKNASTLLEKLCKEMDRRYEIMSVAGVKEISVYNKKSDIKMPYVIVAVDEFADLIMVNGSVEDFIVRIAQKGRAAGIHLILATQRPSVDVVTGLIKANMPVRIAFKTTSGVDSKTVLDTVGAEKLLGLGDGLARIEGNMKDLERFQSPLLTLAKEDEEEIYDKLKELFKGTEARNIELPEIEPEVSPIDQLKRIIATEGETRISELQKRMGIRINIVSDLVKGLVDEGWLEKQGRAYAIVANEDELSKWRE